MSAGTIMKVGRRGFLKMGAAGAAGLVIGFYLPGRFETLAASPAGPMPAQLNAWMLISPDNTVKIMIDKSEMGQGILTALCMIAAEELECDWKKIRTEFAPAAREYFNPAFGMQGTGGSSSVRSSWDPMRKAGARRVTCCCRPLRRNGASTNPRAAHKTA